MGSLKINLIYYKSAYYKSITAVFLDFMSCI